MSNVNTHIVSVFECTNANLRAHVLQPFGYGDADAHVLINHNDPRFAAENLDFDPDSYDDGSKRLKSAGKVSRMRTGLRIFATLARNQLYPLKLPSFRQEFGQFAGCMKSCREEALIFSLHLLLFLEREAGLKGD